MPPLLPSTLLTAVCRAQEVLRDPLLGLCGFTLLSPPATSVHMGLEVDRETAWSTPGSHRGQTHPADSAISLPGPAFAMLPTGLAGSPAQGGGERRVKLQTPSPAAGLCGSLGGGPPAEKQEASEGRDMLCRGREFGRATGTVSDVSLAQGGRGLIVSLSSGHHCPEQWEEWAQCPERSPPPTGPPAVMLT